MKFNILAKGSFQAYTGEVVEVSLETTRDNIGQPMELRFVKEGAVTISCEGQLIIDKLHNTRAVVRLYSNDPHALDQFIQTYLVNDDDLVRLTIGHNTQDLTYCGLLDMEGIEYYESTAYGYVLELVFGDLNPLKRIKADTNGGLYSLRQICDDWVDVITTSLAIDNGYTHLMVQSFLSGDDFKFDKSLAGEEPSVYDVLEVYAEAMCGSLRQVGGCLRLLTAPTAIMGPRYTDVDNVVEGVSYATGRAYNTFEYSLKGDQVRSREYSLLGVDKVIQVERGKKCSILPSEFYNQKDSGYSRGRGPQDYYERGVHTNRPANSFITRRGYLTPAVSETKREQYILGFPIYNEEYIDGHLAFGKRIDVEISKLVIKIDNVNGVIAQLEELIKAPAVTKRAYHTAMANYYDVLADEKGGNYKQQADAERAQANTAQDTDLYSGDLQAMRTRVTAYISELKSIVTAKQAEVDQKRKVNTEPATAIAVRRDDKSEWRNGFIFGHGKALFEIVGSDVLIGYEMTIKAKGDKAPISVSIGGGTTVLGDDIRDFLDEKIPDLYMSKDNEIPHLLLEVQAVCEAGGKWYYLVTNSKEEGPGVKWLLTTDTKQTLNYLDMGQVLSEELGATLNLPPLPEGAGSVKVVITGAWYVGFENYTWAILQGTGIDNIFAKTDAMRREEMIRKYNELCKHDWGIIYYLNRFEVSQGLEVAYKDRKATLTINDGRQFDEVLTYETRIGTALGTGANLLDSSGAFIHPLIPKAVTDKNKAFKKVEMHESFVLYALSLLYSRRYNTIEFRRTKCRDDYRPSAFIKFIDTRNYFIQKYEFDLSSSSVTCTARELPTLDDDGLMMLAEQASLAMTAGSYSGGGVNGITRTTTSRRR